MVHKCACICIPSRLRQNDSAKPDHSAAIYFNKEPFISFECPFGKRATIDADSKLSRPNSLSRFGTKFSCEAGEFGCGLRCKQKHARLSAAQALFAAPSSVRLTWGF